MIEINDKRDCVGCGNCVQSCSLQCISMGVDSEGFSYPHTDADKCINCGKCNSVCPIENKNIYCHVEHHPQYFGAFQRQERIRMNSSSGGLFSTFAKAVLQQNGVVSGAILTKDCKVKHIVIDREKDLWMLQGSKYVQSDLNNIFTLLSAYLETGVKVLFSGTPCQVKALYSFLGERAKNLLTIEVVCHGVPSPMIFEQYMKDRKAESMLFRKKERGWRDYDVEIVLTNGKAKREKASQNLYMKGYLQNLFVRPSCSRCPAKVSISAADITLGDFWGIGRVVSGLFDDKGTSLCIVHTKRGQEAWREIKSQLEYAVVLEEDALSDNPSITQSVNLSKERELFFSEIKNAPVTEVLRRLVGEKPKEAVKRHLLQLWNEGWTAALSIRENIYGTYDGLYRALHQQPVVMDVETTLKKMIEEGCSVCRFGDGEMKHICGGETWFQSRHPQLQQRLKAILRNHQDGLLVCVPSIFGDLSKYRERDRSYWRSHIIRTRNLWSQYMDCTKIYYDAFISRCYMPYQDKAKAAQFFSLWKQLWNGRDLLILEGEKTRLGVGNDLFHNARSIQRILCPNTEAFTFYERLLATALEFDKSMLVLIALGPTATILAADLSQHGYQAIDTGHLDIEYEWFLQGAQCKVPVENKFVNEAGAGKGVGDIDDKKYISEIICHF